MGKPRIIFSLASIFSFRMLGLFMIYPVFAIYAPLFHGANKLLIGMALGVYGLTQALLQLPLSMLSDRMGRRPVITGGLIVFALGSMICAITENIYCLILGRALQGAGAIGSTLMACAADHTSTQHRTKAMAILGMSIGLSFVLAMIFGPIINTWLHLSGIFWLTAIFAIIGLFIQYTFIPPTKAAPTEQQRSALSLLKTLLNRSDLTPLNLSILLLHAIFTASFMVIPLCLNHLGLPNDRQWKIYLPTLLGAFLISLVILFFSEKKQLVNSSLLFAIAILGISIMIFSHVSHLSVTILALMLFFIGFSLLEALLPSLVSKIAPASNRGTAMGIYSSYQFLGIFLGGMCAGLIRTYLADQYVFYLCFFLCLFWLSYLSVNHKRHPAFSSLQETNLT